jgi:hypothetical protein
MHFLILIGYGTASIRAIEVEQQTIEFKRFTSFLIENFTLGKFILFMLALLTKYLRIAWYWSWERIYKI